MPVRKSPENKKAYGFQISYFYWSFLNDVMTVKGLMVAAELKPATLLLQPQLDFTGGKAPASSQFSELLKEPFKVLNVHRNHKAYRTDGRRWGKREIIYLSLHCHHQDDSLAH